MDDDASKDIRGASIKFSHEAEDAPFDLIMNTGPQTFISAAQFWEFALAQASGKKPGEPVSSSGLRKFTEGNSLYYYLYNSALRRAPSSFTKLYYHSQLVNHFRAKDRKERYVKYRLFPKIAARRKGFRRGRRCYMRRGRRPDFPTRSARPTISGRSFSRRWRLDRSSIIFS